MATDGHVAESRTGSAARAAIPLPLRLFRVLFGLLLFAGAARFVAKGWVEMQYSAPDFHFHYLFFEWVRPLPGAWLYALFGVQMVAALLVAAGRLYRPAAVAFFLSFTYVELLDKATYLNHYYFVSLVSFLMIFLPLGEERREAGAVGRPVDVVRRPVHVVRWPVHVLRFQIAIVYLFAGLAKLNADWLLRGEPLRTWLASRTGLPGVGWLFDEPALALAMSWGGAAFDLSIPLLLSLRRTRPWAYLAVVGFHAATAVLFPIGMFPWIMIVATLVFFEEDEIRAFVARATRSPGGATGPASVPVPRQRAPLPVPLRPLLAGFFAVQLLLPLRHLAYDGPVLWTEEGYRFSWRVMLVEKSGSVVYRVRDPDSGRSWDVFPGDRLTMQQEKQMSFQPDMILELARHLADEREMETGSRPEVRADAFVSLNGRPSRRLVDPDVDLANVEPGLASKGWILPMEDDAAERRAATRTAR